MVESPTCLFEGCDRRPRSKGEPLCEGHYYQRRRGTPLRPLQNRVTRKGVCIVDECEKPRRQSGLCVMHAQRLNRHGDVNIVIHQRDRNLPRGERHPMWAGEDLTYSGAHQRLRTVRGPARDHDCVRCGGPARQWSYVGPREPGQRQPYSADIYLYEPMCVPCHKRSDLAAIDSGNKLCPDGETGA